jgi:hypothetical protein
MPTSNANAPSAFLRRLSPRQLLALAGALFWVGHEGITLTPPPPPFTPDNVKYLLHGGH